MYYVSSDIAFGECIGVDHALNHLLIGERIGWIGVDAFEIAFLVAR